MKGWRTIIVRKWTADTLDRLKAEFGVKGKSDVIDALIEFYLKNSHSKGGAGDEAS